MCHVQNIDDFSMQCQSHLGLKNENLIEWANQKNDIRKEDQLKYYSSIRFKNLSSAHTHKKQSASEVDESHEIQLLNKNNKNVFYSKDTAECLPTYEDTHQIVENRIFKVDPKQSQRNLESGHKDKLVIFTLPHDFAMAHNQINIDNDEILCCKNLNHM